MQPRARQRLRLGRAAIELVLRTALGRQGRRKRLGYGLRQIQMRK
jgi:hypothetical protein